MGSSKLKSLNLSARWFFSAGENVNRKEYTDKYHCPPICDSGFEFPVVEHKNVER